MDVFEYLRQMQKDAGNPTFTSCVTTCLCALEDTCVPSSAEHHHVYDFGNAFHTAEVVQFCAKALPSPNLITAAILHDWGKIYDYAFVDGKWTKTPYRKLIRHLSGSYALFEQNRPLRLPHNDPDVLAIGHMILSHHGRFDWGSPVEPQTEEAYILHMADNWSAQYGPNKAAPLTWDFPE